MPAMSQSSPALWTQLPPGSSSQSPCDRYKHACCSNDGYVYILGGRDSKCLRDFWRYSVVCNEWTDLSCTSEAAPEELEGHSMVAHKGFLYVFGAKKTWVHCEGKMSSLKALMPTNRKGHSAVVLGSAMLVYGGFIDMKGSSQDFWTLDFDSLTWALISGSQQGSVGPGPRHSHSAMAYQDCMYLYGGWKGLQEQRDFWKWNSTNHQWSSLRTKSGPSRLVGHSAVAYKDSMLLFGGGESQNSPNNCLWRYSFTTQTWEQVATLPGSDPPYKMYHCCIGLGPGYGSNTSSTLKPRLPDDKQRPFKNKCFPEPLTFLGSEGAIELETFSLNKSKDSLTGKDAQWTGNCLTFQNKAFRKQWSCREDEQLDEEDEAIVKHLPDLLLVLGGKPNPSHNPISIWQMTLTNS
uniref:leucine-zipper-like transcriptional regulator 1 isoform X2 n=1 Tax=Monopterus albus TaxID=43700 RepID=UPI0009B480E2|nr:leucine-zipper-like transcriptional regulator 1 isoform X2 [Monopterus albus]